MHSARLADPIDTANSLLEAHWIPRQLEVDHDPGYVVKIEPLAGGIGGEEQPSVCEHVQRLAAFVARQTAVNDRGARRDRALQVHERVAILGEHDERFAKAP